MTAAPRGGHAQAPGVLVVGAGPTGATVRVVEAGRAVATGEAAWTTHSPRPGWAEHPAEEAWQAVLGAARTALASYDAERLGSVSVDAVPDLVALWDVDSLGSPRPLIGAADLRADEVCTRMRDAGHDARVAELSGRPPDPRLAGPRLAWIAEHEPHTWALVGAGRYAVGGLDSYLVARMTRGVEHLTDPARAARTQLLDVGTQEWSAELCDLFGVPADALPELVPAGEPVAETDPTTFLGLTLPLAVHLAVHPG